MDAREFYCSEGVRRRQSGLASHIRISGITRAKPFRARTAMRSVPAIAKSFLVSGVTFLHFEIAASAASTDAFVNFETPPVHPIALSPDGGRLAVCNLPAARLEVFDAHSGAPVDVGSVPVGLDPVSVRFRTTNEVWVVNH